MHTLTSAHVASLTNSEIVEQSDLGSIWRLTADNFGILKGLSIKRLLINSGAMRTPHWHANANELTYCVSGTALVSVLDTGSTFASFVVRAPATCFTSTPVRWLDSIGGRNTGLI
jgi:oxalate decarboxylase